MRCTIGAEDAAGGKAQAEAKSVEAGNRCRQQVQAADAGYIVSSLVS